MNSQTDGNLGQGGAAETPNTQSLDLQRVLQQQLRSLQRAGLSALPKATGKHVFELGIAPQPAAAAQAAPTAPQATNRSPTARSSATPKPASASVSQSVAASVPASPAAATTAAAVAPVAAVAPTGSELALPYPQSLPLAQRKQQLHVLNDLVAGCTQCEQLVANRTQTVFGGGDPTARLVFVGEGPGADEDRQGEPFVGASGQLLMKILEACKLSRDQVYLLNTVKCQPPRNRNPSEAEISHCWGYARQQLEILQPEFICCLGSVAAKTLLGSKQPLGKMRQQFHTYRSSRVIVTYHPAYLLRTPSAKRHVWDDMKLLMSAMGVDL